jgi:hypothetical protein
MRSEWVFEGEELLLLRVDESFSCEWNISVSTSTWKYWAT